MIEVYKSGDFMRAEFAGDCDCDDGYTYETRGWYEVAVICTKCRDERLTCEQINKAKIPWEYRDASIDDFHDELLGYWVSSPQRGIMFIGPTGTGKTRRACALLIALIQAGKWVAFDHVGALLRSIRAALREDSSGHLFRRIHKAPFLVLDDLAELRTDWQREIIADLIESRHRSQLITIITTNLSLEDIGSQLDSRGPRIVSRLRDMVVEVPVDGPDWRNL